MRQLGMAECEHDWREHPTRLIATDPYYVPLVCATCGAKSSCPKRSMLSWRRTGPEPDSYDVSTWDRYDPDAKPPTLADLMRVGREATPRPPDTLERRARRRGYRLPR